MVLILVVFANLFFKHIYKDCFDLLETLRIFPMANEFYSHLFLGGHIKLGIVTLD